MTGVVASAQIMMMPLSSPGSDGVQWWHRHKRNLMEHFFFLTHFLCLVSLHLNQAVCDQCCTVMGNSGGKPGQLPSTWCCCIKLKAGNAETTCTSLSTLFQLIHLMNAAQFPAPSKKTKDLKWCMQFCCHSRVLCMEKSEGNHHNFQDRGNDTGNTED